MTDSIERTGHALVRLIGIAALLAWGATTPAISDAPLADPPAETEEAPAEAESEDSASKRRESGGPSEKAKERFAEEVVVTATTREEPGFDLPYTTEVLGTWELHRRQMARTLPEALDEVPGVMVQKTAHGQGSPYIRGFTSFRTLLLVDGVRLNNSVFRSGPNQYWATVDPFSLERLEVVKGPVSALYGSDAVGGTVNALSPSVGRLLDGETVGGKLSYRGASAERSHGIRLEGEGGHGRLRLRLGLTGQDFGDLRAGGEVDSQPRTGYDTRAGDLQAVYELGSERTFTLAHQQHEIDDAWRTHKTVFGISWEGTTVGDERARILDQRRELTYLQYRDETSTALFDSFAASLSYQSQEEERFRVKDDGRSDRQGFDAGTTGLWVRLRKDTRAGQLTYGAEWYRDDVDSFKRKFSAAGELTKVAIQGPVADEATYDLWGAYLQDELSVGERLRLILGARYTGARTDADRVEDPLTGGVISVSERWDSVVGNLRALVRLDEADRWHLFGGVSQGFRAPNLSDLTRFDTARSNEIETPVTDLDPEEFVAYELGLETRRGRSSASLALFYTDIEDLIIRVPTGRTIDGLFEVTKKNSGGGFVQGVELKGRLVLTRGLTLLGNATWLEGEVDTFPTAESPQVREPISRMMPPTAHLGLRWSPTNRSFWGEILGSWADEQDRLSTRDARDTQRIPPGGTPGYELLTLRGGYRFSDRLAVSAAVENVTDEEYRIHGSGVNGPARNFVLSADWRF